MIFPGDYINKVLQGDCLSVLKSLPSESVNCCITSPPYWGLRDYGTAKWDGGSSSCEHKTEKIIKREFHQTGATGRGSSTTTIHASEIPQGDCIKCGAKRIDNQLGLEKTPEEYVTKLVEVFREVRRVLRDDGTVWLNLGDSYASNPASGGEQSSLMTGGEHKKTPLTGYKRPPGLKPKDLVGIPWRVAFALQADGWYLRQDIIWHKPNPMPESVTDRCTKAHEYVFLLAKSAKYYYDAEAIKEDSCVSDKWNEPNAKYLSKTSGNGETSLRNGFNRLGEIGGTRNRRSVWTITTKPFSEAHFATFPPDLIEPMVLAGCPENGVILDPFMGAGTTGMVAKQNFRNYIGIELNQKYIDIAQKRIDGTLVNKKLKFGG